MKIYAISDLHLSFSSDKPMEVFGDNWENHWQRISEDWDSKVTDDDIVLISGDISWAMRLENAAVDLAEIAKRKGKKVLIRGNHDYWWSSIGKVREIISKDMYAVQNDSVKIENVIIAGSRGWTVPETGEKASADDLKLYEREQLRMEMSLKSAEKDRKEGDILVAMIHFPPFNARREASAFTALFEKYSVDFVVYGHLHGGISRSDTVYIRKKIPYFLTSCDRLDFKLLELRND